MGYSFSDKKFTLPQGHAECRMARIIKNLIKLIARHFGYEIRIRGLPPRGFDAFTQDTIAKGLQPATVIDVGVGYGTPWLYQAYPEAHYILVEANQNFRPDIEALTKQLDAVCHFVALGDQPGELELFVNVNRPTSSAIDYLKEMKRHDQNLSFDRKTVQVVRLDDITSENIARPALLKIDVEGFELNVLSGAKRTLDSIDIIVIELSISNRFQKGNDLVEIFNLLREKNFVLYDIIEMNNEIGGPINYFDAAFVRSAD